MKQFPQNEGCSALELREELERLKQLSGVGVDLGVVWLPGLRKLGELGKGRRLLEEVVPTKRTIYVYEEDPEVAVELVRHGFAEWLLNEHSRPYIRLVNRLVEQFMELQYERKEVIVQALVKLMAP